MNHDENIPNPGPNPDMQTLIEPELEARVVAWIAGEASAFEVSELERLVAEKPELAVFKRRMEAVHGLMAEAVRPDKVPVRLSDERRAKLLAAIGARVPVAPDTTKVVPLPRGGSRWTSRAARLYYVVGGLAAAGVLVLLQVPQYPKSQAKESALMRAKALEAERAGERRSQSRGTAFVSTDAEAQSAPVNMPAVPVMRQKQGAHPGANASAPLMDRVGAEPAEELPRISVGLLERARIKPDANPIDASNLLLSSASVGGAAGNAHPSEQDKVVTFGTVTTASKAMADSSRMTGSVTLGASANGVVSDDTFAANSAGKDLAGARVSDTSAFSIRDQPQPLQHGAGVPAAPVAAASGHPLSSFGSAIVSPSAESAPPVEAGSTVPGASPVNGVRDEPVSSTGETITLQAFTVSAPKKQESRNAPAERRDADGAGSTTRELAGAKIALLKEAEVKKSEDSAIRSGPVVDGNAETNASTESVSTFSLHVSDVSFRLAVASAAAFERGENPRMPQIRAEEFYNAFDYGDPAPAVAEKIGARIEQSAHPVLQQRNLLRIAMKVPATGRGAGQPLRLTVLLDTSGSMEREDRRLAVRRALEELIALLGANDRITLIGFARQPRLLAEAVPGHQAGHLVELSGRTPAEGGTNLEEALTLARQLAVRHRLEAAQNRIVLLTDGAANLGNADPAQLATTVETLRQQGIAFDACGIGLEGVGDNVLEALTRKGDGRYYVVDRPEAADAAFARQLAGAFRPAAEDVKLQVRFNPARVGNYRLIGFEQHRLRPEDFRNDQVDAAELAAEEAATALYQVEVLPQGTGEVGEVYVRFRDAATGAMVERSWTIRHDPQAPRFDRASPSLQLAGVSVLLAEKLNDTPLADQFKLGEIAAVVDTVRTHYAQEPRVQELAVLYGRLRRMSGE